MASSLYRVEARAPLFEIARVLVRFERVARFIVKANQSITAFDSGRRTNNAFDIAA
jgi:hypothetical protein